MSNVQNGTTGLDWNGADGHWSASANGTLFEAIKQGGNWVLWVDGVCHYDRYYFATDAMTEAESLAAAPAEDAPAITRADLDWLCITQRAAANDPTSQLLWVQAALAMSNAIRALNAAALDESHAAHAQFLIGRLANYAITPVDAVTIGTPVPVLSERIKDALMNIGAGRLDVSSIR